MKTSILFCNSANLYLQCISLHNGLTIRLWLLWGRFKSFGRLIYQFFRQIQIFENGTTNFLLLLCIVLRNGLKMVIPKNLIINFRHFFRIDIENPNRLEKGRFNLWWTLLWDCLQSLTTILVHGSHTHPGHLWHFVFSSWLHTAHVG